MRDFIFLCYKITADGDCSHEIKRRLLLWIKAMTNLHSILKNRDIYLPTKVRLVKAMVFPVVIYGCESWTIKKAERQRIDAFELWCWRRQESPLNCKEIQPVHPKAKSVLNLHWKNWYWSWIFGYLMWRTDSLGKALMLGKIEEKRMTEDEMVG